MKLPKGHGASIPPSKLRDYLLCRTHPVGRWKARFLGGLGFDETTAGLLERGLLETPSGRRVRMETVWIVERGQDRPRFVTAYPVETAEEEP